MSGLTGSNCYYCIICSDLSDHCPTFLFQQVANVDKTIKYSFRLLLLLLKPAAQAQVLKTKLFIHCLQNPTSNCATEKRIYAV